MRTSGLVALAASATTTLAQYKGFNYGAASTSGAPFLQADFENQFRTAANLQGTSGFTSARLFTMQQAGSGSGVVTSAIPAALATNTKLLLGLWASAGDQAFAAELQALKTAIQQFPQLSDSLVGISVGSEDLYRISPAAAQAGSTNPGANPQTLVNYVRQVRQAISGTAWSSAKIGHVDTWTAFANGSNDVLSTELDFVGVDAYPYFQTADANAVENGASLFQAAINGLTATAKSKDVWITETGWPTRGATLNQAVPGTAQAKKYWDAVGCGLLFGKYSHVFWYTLQDAGAPDPNFGVVGAQLSTTPLYDLSCPAGSSSSSSSASASASSSAGSSSSGSTTGSSGSGSGAGGAGSTSTGSAATSAASTASSTATGTSSSGNNTGSGAGSGSGSGPTTVVIQTVTPTGGASGNGSGSGSGTTTVVTNGSSQPAGSTPSTSSTSSTAPRNTGAAAALDVSAGSALLAVLAGGAAVLAL